jgi:hypothetical protein
VHLGVCFEHRQQELARSRRRRAFEILKSGSFELGIVGVERAKGNVDSAFGQQESEQGEEVFEIAVGAVQKLVVKEPLRFLRVAMIEQPMTAPAGALQR